MSFIYSWVPAYKEIVTKLQDYQFRQPELIQLLRDAGVNVHDDEAVRGTKTPLTEIDPFTFLFFLGKANNYANWVRVLRKLCSVWNIQVQVNDVCGLPTTNAQKLWMFPYEHDRTTEINDLWEFFFSALNETITDVQFGKILGINSVGLQKITEGLFMVDPQKYLCLNARVRPYLETQGISTSFTNYTGLKMVYDAIRSKISLPFYEISFKAYISEITKGYAPSYFRIGTTEGEGGESQLEDMIPNNIVSIGWSGLGDLLKMNPFNKSAVQKALIDTGHKYENNVASRKAGEIVRFVQEIKAGDYVFAAAGSKIKAIGLVISDHYVFDENLYFSHCRCVEWLFKDINDLSLSEGLRTSVIKYEYPQSIRDIEYFLAQAKEKKIKTEQDKIKSILKNMALNRILFGPPGTGKTFHSVSHAVAIIEGKTVEDLIKERESKIPVADTLTVKERYDKYVEEGLITFCTFHQSMSYEDFIEGIKPVKPRLDDAYLKYEVEDGIFKNMCSNASASLYGYDLKPNEYNATGQDDIPKTADQMFSDFVNSNPVGNIIVSRIGKNYTVRSASETEVVISSDNKDDATFKKKVIVDGINYYVAQESLPNIKAVHDDVRSLDTSIFDSLIRVILTNSQGVALAEAVENNTVNGTTEKKRFVLIIDEINRGNVSQVFGELITLIEDDKRLGKEEALTVTLPYSKDEFGVPPNLFIIGTMNTADRSVEALDTALRRRFTFVPMMPDESKLTATSDGIDLSAILKTLNSRLNILKDSDHTIGHAWLMGVDDLEGLRKIFGNKILPLLQEYFYNDFEKLGLLLGDRFFEKIEQVNSNVFATFTSGSGLAGQYDQSWRYELKDFQKLEIADFTALY